MKRAIIAVAMTACIVTAAASPAKADWPADRPIRVLVGFGAVGGTDIVSRIIAQPLSELLKQSVVVVLARPAIREQLEKVCAFVPVSTSAKFGQFITDEVDIWKSEREKTGIEQK
jgi:hypothetical protein